jgi:hypothetical protein
MPVVTSARVGTFVGTGVAAREKLRIAATASATPTRMRKLATIQRTVPPPGRVNGDGSRRSAAIPSRRAPRNSSGGLAITPAVVVSFTSGLTGSMLMPALADAARLQIARNDNLDVII